MIEMAKREKVDFEFKDKPLTEKEIIQTPQELGIKSFVWLDRVQSAKRLLRSKVDKYPAITKKTKMLVNWFINDINACFQIEDEVRRS